MSLLPWPPSPPLPTTTLGVSFLKPMNWGWRMSTQSVAGLWREVWQTPTKIIFLVFRPKITVFLIMPLKYLYIYTIRDLKIPWKMLQCPGETSRGKRSTHLPPTQPLIHSPMTHTLVPYRKQPGPSCSAFPTHSSPLSSLLFPSYTHSPSSHFQVPHALFCVLVHS